MAIRFIIYGGSRERNNDGSIRKRAIADNSAFHHAALNVASDYKDWKQIGKMFKIDCADTIVSMINKQPENSVKSLDILSHGSELTLNFSVRDDQNCGFYATRTAGFLNDAVGFFSDNVNVFDARGRRINAINFKRFTADARIQFHGCTAAGSIPVIDNLAKECSQLLKDAGKNKAVVIGHYTKSNPLIKGSETTIRQQDYRHGTRLIYNQGELLFKTTKEGYISDELIGQHIRD